MPNYPSASIHVCGNFNGIHEEELVTSMKKARMKIDFFIACEVIKIIDQRYHLPNIYIFVYILKLIIITYLYQESSVLPSHSPRFMVFLPYSGLCHYFQYMYFCSQ